MHRSVRPVQVATGRRYDSIDWEWLCTPQVPPRPNRPSVSSKRGLRTPANANSAHDRSEYAIGNCGRCGACAVPRSQASLAIPACVAFSWHVGFSLGSPRPSPSSSSVWGHLEFLPVGRDQLPCAAIGSLPESIRLDLCEKALARPRPRPGGPRKMPRRPLALRQHRFSVPTGGVVAREQIPVRARGCLAVG